jgi:hypothetical protein
VPDNNEVEAALQKAHDAMDDLNARLGSMWHLCRFCTANEYDGERGIIHDAECPVLVARLVLAKVKG